MTMEVEAGIPMETGRLCAATDRGNGPIKDKAKLTRTMNVIIRRWDLLNKEFIFRISIIYRWDKTRRGRKLRIAQKILGPNFA